MSVRFTRPQLVDLYCTQRFGADTIARLYGCCANKVRVTLRVYGIEVRKLQHASQRSGIHGITWDRFKRKWRVTAYANGKQKTIGRFATLEEAAAARSKA
jgi:hypothetical protein